MKMDIFDKIPFIGSNVKNNKKKSSAKKKKKPVRADKYRNYPIEKLIEKMSVLEYELMLLNEKKKIYEKYKDKVPSIKEEIENIEKDINRINKQLAVINREKMKKMKDLEKLGYRLYIYDIKTRTMVDYGIDKLANPIILDKNKRLLIFRKHKDNISVAIFRTPLLKSSYGIEFNFYHPRLFSKFYKDSLFVIVDMLIDIIKYFGMEKLFVKYIMEELGIDVEKLNEIFNEEEKEDENNNDKNDSNLIDNDFIDIHNILEN